MELFNNKCPPTSVSNNCGSRRLIFKCTSRKIINNISSAQKNLTQLLLLTKYSMSSYAGYSLYCQTCKQIQTNRCSLIFRFSDMNVGVGYSAFPLVDLYLFFFLFSSFLLSGIMIVLQTPTTLPDLSPVYDLSFFFIRKSRFFCSSQDVWGASPYSGICSTSEVSFKFGGVSSSLSSECRELPTNKGELEITGKRYYLLQTDVSVCSVLNI